MRAVANLVAIALAMAACERDEPYFLDVPDSRIGDRTSSRMKLENRFNVNREEHLGTGDFAYTLETITVADGRPSSSRVIVEHDHHTLDGQPFQRMAGTYLVEVNSAGAVSASRFDGSAVQDFERGFFEEWKSPLSAVERRELRRRAYRTGERFEPSSRELRVFGFGDTSNMRSMELVVVRASASSMDYRITFEQPAKDGVPLSRSTVTGTVAPRRSEQRFEVVWLENGQERGRTRGDLSATSVQGPPPAR